MSLLSDVVSRVPPVRDAAANAVAERPPRGRGGRGRCGGLRGPAQGAGPGWGRGGKRAGRRGGARMPRETGHRPNGAGRVAPVRTVRAGASPGFRRGGGSREKLPARGWPTCYWPGVSIPSWPQRGSLRGRPFSRCREARSAEPASPAPRRASWRLGDRRTRQRCPSTGHPQVCGPVMAASLA